MTQRRLVLPIALLAIALFTYWAYAHSQGWL